MAHTVASSLLVLCLLHAVPAIASAQDTQDGQLWIQGLALGRLSEHWRSHIEVQPRWFDDVSELGLVIIRTAIGRQLTPRLTVWAGHAWVPRTQGEGVRHEQRIWQQLSITLPTPDGWTATGRLRLEQRWQNEPWDGTSHRIRLMARGQRRLGAQSPWQIAVYDEFKYNLDDTPRGPAQGFDRNRLYAGVMRAVQPALTAELGYLWEHGQFPGPLNRNDHAVVSTITVQWPRR